MIAIVGGGITGLALAWELARRGADFVVLEASERPGGVIESAEVEGRIVDWGPQRTRLTPAISDLVDALGLGDELMTAPEDLDLFVFRHGRLREVPLSPGSLLRSDVVSTRAKLRLMLEPLTAAPDPRERVADCLRRKLGRELYEAVAGPLYGGLYASDPQDMEVGVALLPTLRQLGVRRSLLVPFLARGGGVAAPRACSFRDGMQSLPAAMAAAAGPRLRLSAPVSGISRRGAGWVLDVAGEPLEAGTVVLATPAPEASRLLAPVAPELSAAVGGLTGNPLAVVALDARTDLRGLGFQMSFTERGAPLRGVTFNDSLFGRRDLYTAYLGGALRPDVVRLGDDELGATARAEFQRCTGYDARPLAVRRTSMPAWDVTWRGLHGQALPPALHLAGSWWSRPGLPGRLAEARRLAEVLAPTKGEAARPAGSTRAG